MQVGILLKLEVDQVNVYKGTISPSTDLWPNLCATYKNEEMTVAKLFPKKGPPLKLTLHNALRMGNEAAVNCYVLRRAAMPVIEGGEFVVDNETCDGRFRGKLHSRQQSEIVQLIPHWEPGPVVPPPETFLVSAASTDSDESDEDDCEIAPRMEPIYGVRAVTDRQVLLGQTQYMILWAGYDQGTWETRDTWNFQWDVDFKPPHLSKEQVFAAFDELDSKAPPTTTKKRTKRKR